MTEATQGRREQNRVARNHDLLLAATEIIATEGVEGLTMQAVADNVGCAVGTIYTYFESKSALLAALQLAAIQTLIDTFTASAESWERAISKAILTRLQRLSFAWWPLGTSSLLQETFTSASLICCRC